MAARPVLVLEMNGMRYDFQYNDISPSVSITTEINGICRNQKLRTETSVVALIILRPWAVKLRA
jgi:hypothetical protein